MAQAEIRCGIDEPIGEAIDRLVQVEMRFAAGMPRGIIHRLYDAARALQGAPLSMLAARALIERVKSGDRVLVVTGAGAAPWLPYGETDGPLGAAAIARALDIGLGAKPILVSEQRNLAPIVAAAEGSGIAVLPEAWWESRNGAALAEVLALGDSEGPSSARALFEKHHPKAVIFIEKGSPNSKGVFHTITGTGRSRAVMASADIIGDVARQAGVLTIGIGDGGNEIGFGSISDAVREIQPFGRTCNCPCGGGIAASTSTDILVVAAISNWGAYGVAAALACGVGIRDVLHGAETERRMLERCVAAGAADGILARLIPAVDGTSAASQEAIVTLLGNIVDNALRDAKRGF